MKSYSMAAAAALVLALAPEAAAKKNELEGSLQIEVCNYSGYDAFVATISRNERGWLASGWMRVDNNQCGNVATTNNLVFYAFAEQVGDTNFFWGGDFEQCIMRPGPYDVYVDPNAGQCPAGMETADFMELEADTWGTYTWNLRP